MQSRVNEDATANKSMHDAHVFRGNSCRVNRTQNITTINNFADLKRKFRLNEESMRLDLVIIGDNNLILTPKTLTAESVLVENEQDNVSNSSIPNSISMSLQITNGVLNTEEANNEHNDNSTIASLSTHNAEKTSLALTSLSNNFARTRSSARPNVQSLIPNIANNNEELFQSSV